MGKLITYKLSPQEWTQYQLRKHKIINISNMADFKAESLLQIRGELEAFEKFNEAAISRDQVLVNNLIKKADSLKPRLSILISGGFHTQGITKLLKRKNVAYASV